MILDYVLTQIANAIYALPELYGCTVIYIGENQARVIKQTSPMFTYANNKIVVIEELKQSDPTPVPTVKYNQEFQGDELKGGVINCAFAAISAIEVLGGAAAEPVTGGLSTVAVYAGYLGMATSGAQCVNSIARTYVAYTYPLDHGISSWDDNKFYTYMMGAIDIANLATGGVAMATAGRDITNFLKLRGSLVLEEGKVYTNAEKIAAYKNAIKTVSKNEVAAKEFEKLVNSLKGGARMLRGNEVVIRQSTQELAKLIAAATLEKLSLSVKTIIVNATSTVINGMPSNYTGSASGSIYSGIKIIGLPDTVSRIGKLVFHIIDS